MEVSERDQKVKILKRKKKYLVYLLRLILSSFTYKMYVIITLVIILRVLIYGIFTMSSTLSEAFHMDYLI